VGAAEIDLDATIEQLGSLAQTIQQSPRSTIDPSADPSRSVERRALSALERLSLPGARSVEVLEKLGEGGMGVVHLGRQPALVRTVAVKTLREDRRDPRSTAKLLREAWITGTLEHPNVVPVYDLGVDPLGGPQLVLRRIEGVEWSSVMHDDAVVAERFGARSRLEWNLRIFLQVAQAVRFAHSRGIVHRDLKPENVMIGAFGEVYVLDWGLAVSLRDDGSGRLPLAKDAREMAGTPAYMAPEMLGGALPRIDERTDVYLLGAILYEIAADRAPHTGDTLLALIRSIVASKPHLPVDVPPELARIVTRAMAADPVDRYPDVDALRVAVEEFLTHRGSAALAEEAAARLVALIEELRRGRTEIDRELVYNLFGEVRFGFQQALRAWPDNPDARVGLREATLAMVEYELSEEDPRAAAALLGTLEAPPPALAERIAELRGRKEAERRALEQKAGDLDPTTGRRTRTFIALMLGALWTAAPLTLDVLGGHLEPVLWILWSTGLYAIAYAIAWWARFTLSRTAYNRAITRAVRVVFAGQVLLGLGALVGRLEPDTMATLVILVWTIVVAQLGVSVEPRLLPSAAVFAAAFLAASREPAWTYRCMAAANLLLTVNLVAVWRPATLRRTPDEVAALAAAEAEFLAAERERRRRRRRALTGGES
jgi:serine/threonine-protein kinase